MLDHQFTGRTHVGGPYLVLLSHLISFPDFATYLSFHASIISFLSLTVTFFFPKYTFLALSSEGSWPHLKLV